MPPIKPIRDITNKLDSNLHPWDGEGPRFDRYREDEPGVQEWIRRNQNYGDEGEGTAPAVPPSLLQQGENADKKGTVGPTELLYRNNLDQRGFTVRKASSDQDFSSMIQPAGGRIFYDGQEYPDAASFELATNPNIPQDIKKVYISSQEPETAPKQAPEASRSVTDKLLGIGGERYQTWPERAVRSIIGGLALPGDVAQGNTDPSSPEAIERAFDLASTVVLGPAPLAGKLADGTLGSFAGAGSKTADNAARMKAAIREAQGKTKDEIYQETGWFKGSDDRWRYEISDEKANLIDRDWKAGDTGKLSDFYDNPKVFEAYPELKDMNFEVMGKDYDSIGGYNNVTNTLKVRPDLVRAGDNGILDVINHEIQHWIQNKEGFAQGSNPFKAIKEAVYALKDAMVKHKGTPYFNDLMRLYMDINLNYNNFANYMYQRVPGEVEANLSTASRQLTEQQRRDFAPWERQQLLESGDAKNTLTGGKYYPEFNYPKEGQINPTGYESSMADFLSSIGLGGGFTPTVTKEQTIKVIQDRMKNMGEIPLNEMLKHGDGAMSPMLTKEGKILSTGGDHSSLANAQERLDTGLVRIVYGPNSYDGKMNLSIELTEGQVLSDKQKQVLKRLANKANVFTDIVDVDGNRLSSAAKLPF